MDMQTRRGFLAPCSLGLVMGMGVVIAPARADIIEFTFGGNIRMVTGPSPVSVGDSFAFSYIFDSETMDIDPAPNFGLYPAISQADVVAGSFMHSASQGDISVLDNGIAGDSYQGIFNDPLVVAGANLGQIVGAVFMNDSLPDDLDLNAFDIRDFFLQVEVGPAVWEARGRIETFRRRVIPGPGVMAVGLLGALGLGVRRRR